MRVAIRSIFLPPCLNGLLRTLNLTKFVTRLHRRRWQIGLELAVWALNVLRHRMKSWSMEMREVQRNRGVTGFPRSQKRQVHRENGAKPLQYRAVVVKHPGESRHTGTRDAQEDLQKSSAPSSENVHSNRLREMPYDTNLTGMIFQVISAVR